MTQVASVEQLPSGRWRGVYRNALGAKRHTPPVASKRDAKRAASVAEDRSQRDPRHDPRSGRLRWGTWCDAWLAARSVEASTARGSASYLSKWVRPRWDDVALAQISRLALQRWVRDLERELAPSSVRQAFYLLSASLAGAVDEGYLDANPCTSTRITLPELPQATERYLTDGEVTAIFFHLDGRFRMLAELLLGTGMRIGEVCGLHWHRVDLDRGVIDVVETWNVDARKIKPYPKGKRRRTIPITPDLVELLTDWRDAHPPRRTCGRPHEHDPLDRAGCRSGLVLVGERGAPIDQHNFTNREWAWALGMAEVDAARDGRPPLGAIRVHDLRHTYASRYLTGGGTIERLQLLLGHASIVTTQRYGHLMDDGHDEVRAALTRGTGRGTVGGRTVADWHAKGRRPKRVPPAETQPARG